MTPEKELAASPMSSKSVTEIVNGSHKFVIQGYPLAKGMGVRKHIASDTSTFFDGLDGGEISENSVASTLALADQYHAMELKACCLKFAVENIAVVMRSSGFEYLRDDCPSLQSELLKIIAGCEEECNSGGKSRSVCAQLSIGEDSNDRRVITEDSDLNLEKVKAEMLGTAKKLRTTIEKSTAMFDKEKAQERLSKLSGGVAVLKVCLLKFMPSFGP
ncbi:BTB/POZ and MATH domain-containing protein 4 isoform X1 [Canna indica]|uniref:BTB/POZ and MATH domain-containing protein 4 isoform X1 n=1 Tax=Canna indica TaxID=4628 RepID=A0AAQ3QML7_9LILI|nr:BTB/POZ and MATH domain-containing protein 4 isoform X1 [Canna indica]